MYFRFKCLPGMFCNRGVHPAARRQLMASKSICAALDIIFPLPDMFINALVVYKKILRKEIFLKKLHENRSATRRVLAMV
jgi:hypothetical protein